MKASTLIHAVALCAIASTPAHAYFINYYPADFKEGIGATAKSLQSEKSDGISSRQALEQALFTNFGLSYLHSTRIHHGVGQQKSAGANAALASTTVKNQGQDDAQEASAESVAAFSQEDNSLQTAADHTSSNNLWPIELSDVENLFNGKTGRDASAAAVDKWTNILRDKGRDVAWSENPYAPSPAKAVTSSAVPEPASLGLVTLGLSALALSRRRAHRKSI